FGRGKAGQERAAVTTLDLLNYAAAQPVDHEFGIIVRSAVYHDDLGHDLQSIDYRGHHWQQEFEILLFVERGNDNGDVRRFVAGDCVRWRWLRRWLDGKSHLLSGEEYLAAPDRARRHRRRMFMEGKESSPQRKKGEMPKHLAPAEKKLVGFSSLEPGLVFDRSNERLDHFGLDVVAVELVQFGEPEIVSGVIGVLTTVGIT